MAANRLQIVIPFHQPLQRTEVEIERACERCYVPLIDQIEAHPSTKLTLHFTGHLLDFLSRRRPELLLRLKNLVRAGQVEVLGGLFYGGPPALLPEIDVRGQVEMMAEFWESFLGDPPTGLWLPELAWVREMPRLLEDSGLAYGFVSASQLEGMGTNLPALGICERGGLRTAAFLLDPDLSAELPTKAVDEWLEMADLRASSSPQALLTAWVRAESLGLEPGTAAWCLEHGWLERFLDALGQPQHGFETVLPRDSYRTTRPAQRVAMREGLAPELCAMGMGDKRVHWSDFRLDFAEADTLYRRMLRASEKLRYAVMAMEEESLEEEWSDTLATAQRLVFASQTPEAYWRGLTPGFSDPECRDAVLQRLVRAELMIDSLVQGEDDWIAAEEDDLDADLDDEVFAANRRLSAWIVPADSGAIRSLDDRHAERNVLDVGNRRREPFFADMGLAPAAEDVTEDTGAPRRGKGLRKLTAELPAQVDSARRLGIREHLLYTDATPGEYFSGALTEERRPVSAEVLRNDIDEEGDGTYHLDTRVQAEIEGVRTCSAVVNRSLTLPIDAAELHLTYSIEGQASGGALVAVEIPLRLGSSAPRLMVNDIAADAVEAEHLEVRSLRLADPNGAAVRIQMEPSLDIWLTPVRATVRDLAGFRATEQGMLVVPIIRLAEGSASATIRLTLEPAESLEKAESAG